MMFNPYNQSNFNRNQQPQAQNKQYSQQTTLTQVRSDTNSNRQPDINNLSSDERFNSNPKLKDIDPLKLKIIMEIKQKSKDKSMEELLPEIMKVNQELNRRNMAFTKKETVLLLEVIEESLSPEEKKKFNMLKGFMNM
ncbi:MAG: hypothetical protein E7258_03770 [Lachnospiraceae bacterium]|nr:hypothetical protein [Lachnospiraceae bacterium]